MPSCLSPERLIKPSLPELFKILLIVCIVKILHTAYVNKLVTEMLRRVMRVQHKIEFDNPHPPSPEA
jgi:hypothetical protein